MGGNVGDGVDLVEHPDHFLVGAAMQRAGQRRCGRGHAKIRVAERAAHRAHGAGAAVLLMVDVQDEEHLERAGQHRVGRILGLDHPPQHVHEVFRVAQVVIRVHVGKTQAMPVGHGGNGGHLGDQPLDLQQPVGGIVHLMGLGIDRRQGRHGADQHRHGVGIVPKALHELLHGLVQHGVVGDLVDPVVELAGRRQFAKQNQVGNFKKRAMLGQLLNGIAAILQNPAVAVDERDVAAAGSRVHEGRIVQHQAEVVIGWS